MQHHRQHGACMASVFWVGLGLSCGHGPGSGQLGSESVLSWDQVLILKRGWSRVVVRAGA